MMKNKPHILGAWVGLFRPWSYAATFIPFLVAAALLHRRAPFTSEEMLRWGVGLFVGLLFQATVNLLNTWGDEKSGVDRVPGAICTTPQIQAGLISLRTVLFTGLFCAFLAACLGCGLCVYRTAAGVWTLSFPLFICGFVGALGALNYSTGVRFKYRGFGVPFVSLLMGPLEILVACVLTRPQEGIPFGEILLVSLPVALLVGVILHGNDMRDRPTDQLAGIHTFALRAGVKGSLAYYIFCHLAIYGLAFCIVRGPWRWLPVVAFPFSVRTVCVAVQTYCQNKTSPAWRGLERASGFVHLVFGLAYAVALAMCV